jgi:hypothetical protein
MQFFADALGFERILAAIQWIENGQGRAHERIVGEDASEPDCPFVRVHGDQRVDTIVRPQLVAPASLRCAAAQPGASDFSDLHNGAERREKSRASGMNLTSGSSGKIGRRHRL